MVAWHSKKQTSVALSTIEAEYIAIESCGTQILWIMHQLLDFDSSFESVPIMCDNSNAISLSRYTVHHSRANTLILGIILFEIKLKTEILYLNL